MKSSSFLSKIKLTLHAMKFYDGMTVNEIRELAGLPPISDKDVMDESLLYAITNELADQRLSMFSVKMWDAPVVVSKED